VWVKIWSISNLTSENIIYLVYSINYGSYTWRQKWQPEKGGLKFLKEFDMYSYNLSWHGDMYTRIYKHFVLKYLSNEKDLLEISEDCQLPTRIAKRVPHPKTADGLWRNYMNIETFGVLQFSEFSTPIRNGQVFVKPATLYFKWGARVGALRDMSCQLRIIS